MSDLHWMLRELRSGFRGDIFTDEATLLMYATDASAYREKPLAVTWPKDKDDIALLIRLAGETGLPLIPRTAGTSLAGQVVGKGVIVDVSRYMNRVIEVNAKERWVRLEPGVVLDELNMMLVKEGLFFGPETSTSNRCMIGGMVGNNSCGAHSTVYGSTRDHTLSVRGFLSDGSEAEFGGLSRDEFEAKCRQENLEGRIYRNIRDMLSDQVNRENILREYPHPDIERRNTGYALDLMLDAGGSGIRFPFNFCRLLAGSEGTLLFMTSIKLNLVPLPPPVTGLLCVHCATLEDAFEGNLLALQHDPYSVELIDHILIECTKDNIEQRKNRFFIEGEPAAVLIVEFACETAEEVKQKAEALEALMRKEGRGYHFPLVTGPDINKVWALRKAGLGLLSNVPGDAKPVTVIEDTAVRPEDLPAYMAEFREVLRKHGKDCVYYAHIATGELHLKPVLNLKDPDDLRLFREIGTDIARLVKKYRGSLSGEHGDGRLRGEFVRFMIGEQNYALLRKLKATWDPQGIFNPGKITDAPPMDLFLRYEPGQQERKIKTYFDFPGQKGILNAVEQCNGSGDCRKSELIGGTMCPSYMATRDEHNTTRARANILREFLSHSGKKNPFDHPEIKAVLDLCLSCKGCKSECPSNVDMAKYKAEFLQHYYDAHGVPLRSWLIANITRISRLGALLPGLFNFFVTTALFSAPVKALLGFAPKRSIPTLYRFTLRQWLRKEANRMTGGRPVYLFVDEFTDYNDTAIGVTAVTLLQRLGYEVRVTDHEESGRTFISKGMLKKAKAIAVKNVSHFAGLISEDVPLLGIEPSGILTFRDEYPDLVPAELAEKARRLGKNALLIEEFLVREFEKGNISRDVFTKEEKHIRLHGHCQQKAVASTLPTKKMLQIPENFRVEEIKSGCCGMAGSFGYEKEHYDLSMKVGELVLFPAVRSLRPEVIIAAPGTSCRHQILDGTRRKALHPVEVLFGAMK